MIYTYLINDECYFVERNPARKGGGWLVYECGTRRRKVVQARTASMAAMLAEQRLRRR